MSNRKEAAKANAQAAVSGGNNIATAPDNEDTKDDVGIKADDVLVPNPDISVKDDEENVLVSLKHPQGIVFTTPDNRKILINGNAAHLRGLKKGALPTGGFGLTTVSQADWEYIKKTYGGMNVFKNGLIFAQNDYASAMDMQKDHDEIKSGMEPVSVGAESPVEALRKVAKAPKDS